jgi:hypothetical protein
VSAPNQPAGPVSSPAAAVGSAGRLTANGSRVYRLVAPQVVWWTWVGIVVLSLGDLFIQGYTSVSLEFIFGLLTATGVVYSCTLWSKVVARDDGIEVLNPFRAYNIPWGAVRGIFLADSVEVVCARGDQNNDKTVYSWALSSPRRARARQQLRGLQWDRGRRSIPSGYDQLPGSAKEVAKMTPAEVMARELANLSDEAKAAASEANADGSMARAVMSAKWAWQPAAAVLVPGIGLAITALVK